MALITATQIRVGTIISWKGNLYRTNTVSHITPGNWRGMVQTKLRNIMDGTVTEQRFRSEDKLERVTLEQRKMEYLYNDNENYHFMDTENYEQITLEEKLLDEAKNYLIPNIHVSIEMYKGQPIGVELPKTVDLKVQSTEPGLKGATASGSGKPAVLETGLVINVPQFVSPGDVVRVDTEEGKYLERAK